MAIQGSNETTGNRGHTGGNRARLAVLALSVCAIALALGVSLAGASKVVVSSFGSEGAQGGQFVRLTGVAVNSSGAGAAEPGDVYVVEGFLSANGSGNNRIQRFDGDGNFIEAWGKDVDSAGGSGGAEKCTVAAGCKAGVTGTAEGEFANPTSVAVNQNSGDVYVFEGDNRRVQQFSADGAFVRAWGWGVDDGTGAFQVCTSTCQAGSTGANGGQFANSTGSIAIDGAGGVYVSDGANRRVQKFTAEGAFVRTWGWDVIAGNPGVEFEICTSTTAGACKAGATGTGNGQFSAGTLGVATDPAGNAYVTNGTPTVASNVQKFDPAGNFLAKLPIAHRALGGVAVDPGEGHVFVVETIIGSGGQGVIEEFDSSGTLVDTHIPAGTGAVALNTSTVGPFADRIYSLGAGTRVDILEDAAPPIASIDPAGEVTATTVELSGSVQPNGKPTTYRFEHSKDGGAGWVSATFPEPALGDGTGSGEPDECPAGDPPLCDVSGQLEGLLPNTEYLARIVATNSLGLAAPSDSVSFTTAPEAPRVGLDPSTAGQSTAALRGTVDPRGSQVTECRFEWGPTSALGNSAPCEALPGSGQGPVKVEADLAGLEPGATYRYRLVAVNVAGRTNGAIRSLDVGTALPDRRAWEMVSPPDKNGGEVIIYPHRSRAAQQLAPGQPMAFGFTSLVSFAGVVGSAKSTDYIAVRSPQGWKTHGISPPQDSPAVNTLSTVDAFYQGEFSPDLGEGVTNANATRDPLTADSAPVSKVMNLYLRTDVRSPGDGSYQLVTACPRCIAEEESLPTVPVIDSKHIPTFAGASTDFGLLAFESTQNLTVDASGDEAKAYEWERASGEVRLAGRIPASGDRCDDVGDGPACLSASPLISEVGQGKAHWRPATVSTDGEQVLFRVRPGPEDAGAQADYYLRLGGHATVQVNASEKSVPEAPQKVVNAWSVAPDLRHVFFTTVEGLIDEDNDGCLDLYRYSLAPLGEDGLPDPGAHHLTRVSTSRTGGCSVVRGAVGVSEDGETAYFLAGRQLVPGEPAVGGANYLYRWHQGDLTYIGKLSDNPDDSTNNTGEKVTVSTYTARTTPDGSHLLFSSESGAGLTGYEHGECIGGGCIRFYLYDAEASGGEGELTCVSCRPDGAVDGMKRDTIDVILGNGAAERSDHINHALSDDGRYVFFASANPLVPSDTNGRYDVYRYDSVNGSLALISSGEHAQDSYFLDAKGDGADVFFATAEQLSGWDVDGGYDAYDARIGGGLPEPPPVPQSCVGDACQPAPQLLDDATPASSSFAGAGNRSERKPSARRCPKGKRLARRGGKSRCVKRQAKRRRRADKRRAKARGRASHNHRRAGR